LGEAFFQRCLAVEQDLEVVGVFQIADQRGVGDHALEETADGVMAALAPGPVPEVAKKSFHDVIRPLGRDLQGAVPRFHGDRIGEEFISIFVDLLHHRLPVA
jgi:hypothetical protein